MMIQRGAVAPHQWEGNDDTERSGRPASVGRL